MTSTKAFMSILIFATVLCLPGCGYSRTATGESAADTVTKDDMVVVEMQDSRTSKPKRPKATLKPNAGWRFVMATVYMVAKSISRKHRSYIKRLQKMPMRIWPLFNSVKEFVTGTVTARPKI